MANTNACPNNRCGHENRPDAKYCARCGVQLDSASRQSGNARGDKRASEDASRTDQRRQFEEYWQARFGPSAALSGGEQEAGKANRQKRAEQNRGTPWYNTQWPMVILGWLILVAILGWAICDSHGSPCRTSESFPGAEQVTVTSNSSFELQSRSALAVESDPIPDCSPKGLGSRRPE